LQKKDYLWYFKNSPGAGRLEGANASGRASNRICGDVVVIELVVRGEKVQQAAFQAAGCSGAIAAASALTQMVKGMKVEEALAIQEENLLAELGTFPASKRHAVALSLEALRCALGRGRSDP